MHLMHEDMARAQTVQRIEDAARLRRVRRLAAAHRAARRADEAALRARLLALAVIR